MKKTNFIYVFVMFTLVLAISQCTQNQSVTYTGKPFMDSLYTEGIQNIPGKIQCEYYDFGGEGVAYHDSDAVNNGSGKLNPADGTYLHEFRKNEGVDISYTKFNELPVDNSPYNLVEPEKDQLYVGWTEPGEWIKYTVQVQKSGLYTIGLMYASNRGGTISLSVDKQDVTGPMNLITTYVQEDTVAWRQWHHWNYMPEIGQVKLEKGIHIMTLTTLTEGNMNYDFLEFKLQE